ncbi:MAG: response regulator [Marinilabiliaceae bacterium]|nr:response regulator [Marinilabiliaceae bacterium]
MLKRIFQLFLIIYPLCVNAQVHNYRVFDNYKPDDGANSVRFILQDSLGLIWFGTDKGLYSFDGYTAYPHYSPGNISNCVSNCGLFISNNHLLQGTEFGLLLYNIKTDQYEPILSDFKQDVRSLQKVGDNIWIGCFDGLFIYNIKTGTISQLWFDKEKWEKHRMNYSLLADAGYIYMGSNGKFARYSIESKKFELLDINRLGGNYFVHSILKDDKNGCIWVGQGSGLLKYFPATEKLEYIGEFDVVKSMALDYQNNLVIGTDNGLCIFNEKEKRYILHDSREPKSLANNVVWCVFNDKSDNIWLGTDNGISLSPKKRSLYHIPIYTITGTGEGNQFYFIYRDSSKKYWLGGTNGLIMCEQLIEQKPEIKWYKMGGTRYHISHNHIRHIFEDSNCTIWVGTDYGLNRFDRQSQSFIQYLIYAPDGIKNANWAYDILEDDKERFWLASYNGGVFVISKEKLFSDNYSQIADIHLSTKNGLSGNNIDFIVLDKSRNVWTLARNSGIDIINSVTLDISTFPINKYSSGVIPNYLLADINGDIWAGYRNGVVRIETNNRKADNITLNGAKNAEVLAMTEVGSSIWISTTEGIWVVDKDNYATRHITTMNRAFTSIYFDVLQNEIILGGTDMLALSKPDIQNQIINESIVVSAIYINNERYKGKEGSLGIGYTNKIKLTYNQNNIELDITDFNYTEENRGAFIYKNNDSKKWTTLTPGENRIKLSKLDPGVYDITMGKMSNEDNLIKSLTNFTISITPPWYGTRFARIIYLLLIMSFIWWVYYFITARNRMKYEQMEKEKSLEQSKLKISFFTDVAHEFKTPLSLIIAPLSRLIQGIKNEKDRDALEMVHKNAMKLNSLIHQAIDYYRDDSKVNIGLLLSKVELVEFARSILSTYHESLKDKQIEFIFNTNIQQLFLNIDIVKIESAFNNLLSNACKFVNPGDSIIFSIEYFAQQDGVEIKVSDTGSGIPDKDIPYIFQRFFQSNNSSKIPEGTGIGLFLVKNYIELHGGDVKVISKLGEGTTFSVWLPVVVSEVEKKPHGKNAKDDKPEKQLIVIVEDNVAIADFVYNTFISDYRCVIAHNGKTGLKACLELKPDIIIADVMMPVMDGLEMAKKLKENTLTATIPLVFLTAKDDKETELKSIQLNIDAFIAKPFDSTILYSRVKQILENRKLIEKKARIENLTSPKIEKAESLDEKFLGKITRIIEDKIDDPELNVNVLCELADISSKQLYRKVKQLTGLTTVDYIKSIRMKKAAMYLSNKNFTIAEVMYMVGFSNHSYFAKCFESRFGLTPRQFIEQAEEN